MHVSIRFENFQTHLFLLNHILLSQFWEREIRDFFEFQLILLNFYFYFNQLICLGFQGFMKFYQQNQFTFKSHSLRSSEFPKPRIWVRILVSFWIGRNFVILDCDPTIRFDLLNPNLLDLFPFYLNNLKGCFEIQFLKRISSKGLGKQVFEKAIFFLWNWNSLKNHIFSQIH